MAPQRRGELGSPGALGMDRRGMRAGAASGLASRALGRAEQLGLTAEQETRLREAERAGRAASIERRATIRIAELDLAELTRTDTPDLAAIEGKLREIGELRIVEQLAGLRLDATARDVLTAEQLEELTRPGRRPSRGR